MRGIPILAATILIVSGCGSKEKSGNQATMNDTAAAASNDMVEQDAIKKVISDFESAYIAEDWSRIQPLLAGDFRFFGTDSAEVINSVADFRKQMENDWSLVDSVRIGQMRNFSMIMDASREIASVTYEVPYMANMGGQPMRATMRFAQTFRKEGGGWKMARGLVAMATVGQSSAEMAEKMGK